ncbi:MAG: hypothetical protein IT577_24335, partial [Verrucomicrobiae bacterium]|nr:hypothetical protein [Verrucomicrobiae bacterium]
MSMQSGFSARAVALVLGSVVACGGLASGQTTNFWTNNANANWTATNFWVPLTNYPDGVGAAAFVTNNISGATRTIYVDTNITLGSLYWGDLDTGNEYDLRTTNAVASRITFDSGDANPALIVHGSGDWARPNFGNFGNGGDDIDAGITVADSQGLFIDAFQNFVINGTNGATGTDPNRVFNGGGFDITKGEDATVFVRTILTNVATVRVLDGEFRVDSEGNPLLRPGISNVVIGVAPGVIDAGANPIGVVTNAAEGTAWDRVQFPVFSVVGANNTNASFPGLMVTNTFDVTINRGHFRSFNRPQTNGLPSVYSGTFTLNGGANETFFTTEGNDFGNISSTVQRTVFTGPITGAGGFTKIGSGEMTLVASNSFAGDLNINRPSDRAIGIAGGVRLMEGGTLSGV